MSLGRWRVPALRVNISVYYVFVSRTPALLSVLIIAFTLDAHHNADT